MNGKQAKRLRRKIQEATIGWEDRNLVEVPHTRRVRQVPTGKVDFKGQPESVTVETVTMRHAPNTTRRAYQAAKRVLKQGGEW